MITRKFYCILTLLTLPFCSLQAGRILLDECPPAVKATIQNNLRGGILDDIDSDEFEGRKVFVVEVDMAGGRALELTIATNGALLHSRQELAVANIPSVVRGALKPLMTYEAEIDEAYRVTVAGRGTTYHIEINRREASDLDVVVSPKGKILSKSAERRRSYWHY